MTNSKSATNPGAAAPSPIAENEPLLTEEEARALFKAKGINVAEWARERGFSIELTRMVLAGKRKCMRGQSHQIAVALGMKARVE